MSNTDGTCEYVLDPDDPETWGGEEGDECYVEEEVLNEDGVWTCPHDSEEGENLCIFHLPVDEKDDEEVVDALVNFLDKATERNDIDSKGRQLQFLGANFNMLDLSRRTVETTGENTDIHLDYADFDGCLELSDSVFDISRMSLKGISCLAEASFVNTKFGGVVDFREAEFKQGADFGRAEFGGKVDFRRAKFQSKSDFPLTLGVSDEKSDAFEFAGGADFGQAEFKETALFYWTEFEGETNFRRTEFKKKADFRNAKFGLEVNLGEPDSEEKVDHPWAEFGAKAAFKGAMFGGKAAFRGSEFRGKADFERAAFGQEAAFFGAEFEEGVNFQKTEFKREVDFNKAEFGAKWGERGREIDFREAEFGGKVDFRRTEFETFVDFFKTAFGGGGDFRGAEYGGDVDFQSTVFGEEANFQETKFSQEVVFFKTEFEEKVDFRETVFEEKVDFRETEFKEEADFRKTEFRKKASFARAEFKNGADFRILNSLDNSIFAEANLTDTNFSGVSLKKSNFEGALMSRATLFGADLRGAKLAGAVLGDIRIDEDTSFLGHPSFHRSSPHTLYAIRSKLCCVYDRDYGKPNYSIPIKVYSWFASFVFSEDITNNVQDNNGNSNVNSDAAKSTYRALEELAGKSARRRLQSQCFVRRQDIQRDDYKQDAKEAESWEERFIAGLRWSRAKVARATLLYGESPWRVIAWSLGIIFSFALLYPLGGWMKAEEASEPLSYSQIPVSFLSEPLGWLGGFLNILGDSLYYSTLTYTALGFGDFQPEGFGRLLTTVETGLGAVMLALLVFILGRRAAR